MTIEGDLTVRLDWDGRRVRRATVRSTRPFTAARVLVGRASADAARIAPRLFGICAQAQGAAAAGAVEAATGVVPASATMAARDAAVLLETVQEYLWRILLDWPQVMGHVGAPEQVAAARRLIAPALARLAPIAARTDGDAPDPSSVAIADDVGSALVLLAAHHVFGVPPADWLALADGDALAAWAARASTLPARLFGRLRAEAPALGRSDVALMPAPRRDALLAAVVPAMRSTPDFERAPVWQGAPVETGALARTRTLPLVAAAWAQYGNSVSTRMVARLAELAILVGRLAGARAENAGPAGVDAFTLAQGEGLAAVQTARGLLLHRVEVAGAGVTRYQIVAPTEWNFHPDGALVRGFEGAEARDETSLARDARLAVQALDPCVACRVEVARA